MRYTKPPLSFSDQAQRLIQHGLMVDDVDLLVHRLSTVSYCCASKPLASTGGGVVERVFRYSDYLNGVSGQLEGL